MNYDIESLKRKLLIKYPFFGSVLANVYYKETRSVQTAATDGEYIYYNPDFLNTLNVDGQLFILAHEVCHVAFNHILRCEGKDRKLWNTATDAVVNQLLQKDGLEIPEKAINIPAGLYHDAEELYEMLLQERINNPEQNGENGNDSNNGDDSDDNDVGHDSHKMWDKAVEKHNNGESNSDSNDLEKKQEELAKMGESKAFEKNREEKKKILDDLKKQLAEEASKEVADSLKGSGSSSNGALRTINNIGRSKQIIDWRYILREAIKYDVDWSYSNATIEEGVVTPHLEEMPKAETEIVLDTSGSVDEELLKNFLRECKNILQHSELKVGCFDTEFYGFKNIRTEFDIDNMEFQGGGGTDFNIAVDAFSGRVENKIVFTDGMSSPPIKEVDAIWLVYGGYHIQPKGGTVIYISDEQLRKLQRFEYDYEEKGFCKVLSKAK